MLRGHGLERDQRRLLRHVIADTHEATTDDSAERRPHRGALETDAEQVVRGPFGPRVGVGGFEIGLGSGVLRNELFGALQRLLRHVALGLRLGDLSRQLRVVYLEQRRSGGHHLTLAHENPGDASLDLGTQVGRLHGFDLARRLNRVDDGIPNGDDDFDRRRGHASTGAPLSSTLGLVACGGGE